jgi:hypothetical protein
MKKLNKNVIREIVLVFVLFLVFSSQIAHAQVNKNLKVEQKVENKTQFMNGISSSPSYGGGSLPSVMVRNQQTVKNQQVQKIKEEMLARIQQIKDAVKRRVAENLITQIQKVNEVLSTEQQKYLSKLEEFLLKQETLINQSPVASAFSFQIAELKTKIANLKDKINSQLQKEYLVQFQNDSELKSAYQDVKRELISDQQELRKELQDLKQEIVNLISAFRGQMQAQNNSSTNSGN